MPHDFAGRWNHNSHYYPLLRSLLPTDRVLDVGAGDGTLARYLGAVALDPDLSMAPDVGGSATALPFASSSFEGVVICLALHHVDPVLALAEVRRVLRPGGAFALLGIARTGSVREVPAELVDAIAHRWIGRGTTRWEPDTVKADPLLTWTETRALLQRELPGSTYRRLPMWRFVTTWTKP